MTASRYKQRRVRELFYAILVTVVFLTALEGMARLFFGSVDPNSENSADRFSLDLLWMPEPFTSTEMGRARAKKPFVDHVHFHKNAPPGTVRILCMGGSVTEGFGFDPEFSYPHQLQLILNEQYDLPMQVQVMNAGSLGGNAYMGQFYFDHLWRSYNPDVITLLQVLNDSNPSFLSGLFMSSRRYVETHRRIQASPVLRTGRDFLRELRSYQLVHKLILFTSRAVSRIDWETSAGTGIFPECNPPDDYERSLVGFYERGEEDGFEVVVMFEGNVNSDYITGEYGGTKPYWDVQRKLARQRDAVWITPDRVFGNSAQQRGPYYYDECHMVKEGLRLYAEQMARDLVEGGVIQRAIARRRSVEGSANGQ